MTMFEQLVARQVSASVVTTISHATDKIAEQMAREILKDPVFRDQMRDLIKQAFRHTLSSLSREVAAAPATTPITPDPENLT